MTTIAASSTGHSRENVYAVLAGAGYALPTQVIGNEQFAPLGLTDKWIVSRTGIRRRRWLAPGDRLSDLAVAASRQALADARRSPQEVDFVVVATLTPDRPSPALATELAARVGAHGPGAVDLNGACTGFLYALDYAVSKIEAGSARCVLVCGADATSRIINADDPVTAPLFGDGVGAVVVSRVVKSCPCRITVRLHSDGKYNGILGVAQETGVLRMDGTEVYQMAIDTMVESIVGLCADVKLAIDDVHLVVPHQANARIIQQIADQLGIARERVALYISEVGNTSAASIPITLALAQADGRLQTGGRTVLTAFGAGATWGAALVDWKGCWHGPMNSTNFADPGQKDMNAPVIEAGLSSERHAVYSIRSMGPDVGGVTG